MIKNEYQEYINEPETKEMRKAFFRVMSPFLLKLIIALCILAAVAGLSKKYLSADYIARKIVYIGYYMGTNFEKMLKEVPVEGKEALHRTIERAGKVFLDGGREQSRKAKEEEYGAEGMLGSGDRGTGNE